jgi:DNA invertase Pin-like site-specific DNA recombinase
MKDIPLVKVVTLVRGKTENIDRRRQFINDLIKNNNLMGYINWLLIKEFVLENVSGLDVYDRDELKEIISMSKNADIDVVIVDNISHLGRNMVKTMHLVEEINNYGVEVFDVSNNCYVENQAITDFTISIRNYFN